MSFSFFGTLGQQDVAAGGGSAPTLVNVTPTAFSTAVTTHNVAMPATVTTGNLLLLVWAHKGSTAITTPNPWAAIMDVFLSNNVSAYAAYKVSAGNEGGTTVNFATNATARAAAQVFQVSGWGGTAGDIDDTNASNATATTRPLPILTPVFGSVPALWIIGLHKSLSQTVTAPAGAGWANQLDTNGGTGTTGAQLSTARQIMTAASNSAGNWSLSASVTTETFQSVIAVKGT